MCTFGELKFYSSRAFLDDEDDNEEEEHCSYQPPRLEVKIENNDNAVFDTAVIFYGDLATAYCSEMLDSSCTKFGTIEVTYMSSDSQSATSMCSPVDQLQHSNKPMLLAQLYSNGKILVAACHDRKDDDLCNAVATELLSLLAIGGSVHVYTSLHLSKLSSASPLDVTNDAPVVIHSLLSPSADAKKMQGVGINPLPQPAFADALPASVLTYCTLRNIACVVLLVFTETISRSDVGSIKQEMTDVLRHNAHIGRLFTGKTSKAQMISERFREITVPENYI